MTMPRLATVFFLLSCVTLTGSTPECGDEAANLDLDPATTPRKFLVAARSQEGARVHARQLEVFAAHVREQLGDAVATAVVPLHTLGRGAWSVLPVLALLSHAMTEARADVLLLADTDLRLHGPQLAALAATLNPDVPAFVGAALHDATYAIIHHYASDFDFGYPDLSRGLVLTAALVHRLAQAAPTKDHFAIDAQYELAKFVNASVPGLSLVDSPVFCSFAEATTSAQECAVSAHHLVAAETATPPPPQHNDPLKLTVQVAIKTASVFHATRVPHLKATWLDSVHDPPPLLFSDTADPAVGSVGTGVPNTESGHCEKLHRMLLALAAGTHTQHPSPWYLIADDDTAVDMQALIKVLLRYDADEAVVVGQRYGFALNYAGGGYNYPTGGSGFVLSHTALKTIAESDCSCSRVDSPDDMWLGQCMQTVGVPLIDEPGFHQAKPSEYADKLLENQVPLVSFHKCLAPGDCAHPLFAVRA
eukprot:m.95168 g.95168  ORF g.95168 m.95168 type:complete len:477 (+) comp15144_c0_seq2:1563-2993(+)